VLGASAYQYRTDEHAGECKAAEQAGAHRPVTRAPMPGVGGEVLESMRPCLPLFRDEGQHFLL